MQNVTSNVAVGRATFVTPQAGRVLITQLRHSQSSSSSASPERQPYVISKVFLKAVVSKPLPGSKATKKDPKTFTLRDINVSDIDTCEKLKEVIKSQLSEDMIKHFDVGYFQGTTVVSIRSSQDLKEVWEELKKGNEVLLWCDGLKDKGKRKRIVSDDSDSDEIYEPRSPKRKMTAAVNEREKRLEEVLMNLKRKHGREYTQMQYRIWSEMYVGDVHRSLTDPPTNSMFCRAGSGDTQKKKKDANAVETFSDVAKKLTTALSPPTSSSTSPAKKIESRSKCYKQLVDLNNLKAAGILSEDEYETEKDTIMAHLKTL